MKSLFLILSILLSFGCTRQTTGDASISLSSSIGSLASGDFKLTRIMVNVRGTGITSPVFYVWDGWAPDDTILPAPATIELSVPSGPDRLVQYLAVYSNDKDENLFYYGDTIAALVSGTNDLTIVAEKMGSGSTLETGIAGRYIRTDGSFPTGKVRLEFKPPNGRPNMIIDHSEIFGGWFSWFTFSDFGFTYTLVGTNEVLLDNVSATSLRPTGDGASGPSTILVHVPEHFKDYGGMSCNINRLNAARSIIFGYFGPGAFGKKVCYLSTTPAATGIFTDSGGTCGSQIPWDITRISENSSNFGAVVGGYESSAISCGEGLLDDKMRFPYEKLRYGGKDELMSEGPFTRLLANQGQSIYFDGSDDINNLKLNWGYAPGSTVGPGSVAGLDIYKKAFTSPGSYENAQHYGEDGMNCAEAAAKAGYSYVSTVTSSATSYTVTGSVTADDYNGDGYFNQGDYQIVLCPFTYRSNSEKFYFSSLAESYGQAPLRAKLEYTGAPAIPDAPPTASGGGYVSVFSIAITNMGTFNAMSLSGSASNSEFSFAGGSFPGTSGTCSTSLNPGASCTIQIAFSPLSPGQRTGQITIGYGNGDGGSPKSLVVPVMGLGQTPAQLVASAPSYDFGTVNPGSYTSSAITITNNGQVPATGITLSGLTGDFATSVALTTCGSGGGVTVLAPGAFCVIYGTFSPPSPTGGGVTSTLSINYSGAVGGTGTTIITFSGEGQ